LTHANNGAKVSGDEVPKKLKKNIKTVHILTLMMAFHDGTSHDVATKVGTITQFSLLVYYPTATRVPDLFLYRKLLRFMALRLQLVILASAFVADNTLW